MLQEDQKAGVRFCYFGTIPTQLAVADGTGRGQPAPPAALRAQHPGGEMEEAKRTAANGDAGAASAACRTGEDDGHAVHAGHPSRASSPPPSEETATLSGDVSQPPPFASAAFNAQVPLEAPPASPPAAAAAAAASAAAVADSKDEGEPCDTGQQQQQPPPAKPPLPPPLPQPGSRPDSGQGPGAGADEQGPESVALPPVSEAAMGGVPGGEGGKRGHGDDGNHFGAANGNGLLQMEGAAAPGGHHVDEEEEAQPDRFRHSGTSSSPSGTATPVTETDGEEAVNSGRAPEAGPDPDVVERGSEPSLGRAGELCVLNLAWITTDDALRDYFSQFGEISHCSVQKEPDGRSRGYGFVSYKDVATAVAVLQQSHVVDQQQVELKMLQPHSLEKPPPSPPSRSLDPALRRKVFVGLVPPDAVDDDLMAHFSQFGKVEDVFLPKPSRGFAFVTFQSEGSAHVALEAKGHVLGSQAVQVKSATPKQPPVGKSASSPSLRRPSSPTGSMRSVSSVGSATPGGKKAIRSAKQSRSPGMSNNSSCNGSKDTSPSKAGAVSGNIGNMSVAAVQQAAQAMQLQAQMAQLQLHAQLQAQMAATAGAYRSGLAVGLGFQNMPGAPLVNGGTALLGPAVSLGVPGFDPAAVMGGGAGGAAPQPPPQQQGLGVLPQPPGRAAGAHGGGMLGAFDGSAFMGAFPGGGMGTLPGMGGGASMIGAVGGPGPAFQPMATMALFPVMNPLQMGAMGGMAGVRGTYGSVIPFQMGGGQELQAPAPSELSGGGCGGGGSGGAQCSSPQLFVSNLPYNTSWQDLRDLFRPYGNIVRTELLKDDKGQPRGKALVRFSSTVEASNALALNHTVVRGRPITVKEDKSARS